MDRYRVEPGSKVRLEDYPTDDTGDFKSREEAEAKMARDIERLAELQERLYAENTRALLIVLQAMDTGGKDGTVKTVMSGVNPTGCEVTAFKIPSEEEADHDFLWRIYSRLPRRGNIGIFNRSHYEDVLVVRVHNYVPPDEWKRRYELINRFEDLLNDTGTKILKFYLHISKDEQKRRLEARLRDADKRWKFSEGDLKERRLWDQYQEAYEEALSRCSTKQAPWYVIPADKKWYRNYVVARTIVKTLEKMDPRPPPSTLDPSKIVIE